MYVFIYNHWFRLIAVLAFCVFCTAPLVGQELIFKNVGNKLKLPSYECYNVVQDQQGYIWISTDNGLCRYNGKTVTIFDKNTGLPDNGIYFLKAGNKSDLRLISANSTILKQTAKGFIPEKYTKKIKDKILRDSQRAYLINETDSGDIVNTYTATFLADRNSGELISLSQDDSPFYLTVFCNGSQSYFVRNIEDSYPQLINGKYGIRILIISGNRKKELVLGFNQKTDIDRRIKITNIDDSVFISIDNRLIVFDKNLSVKTHVFSSKILSLYADPNRGLWVGLFQKGVYYYEDPQMMQVTRHSLDGYSVSGTLMDREGAVWCSTLEKSVFYSNSVHALSYGNIPSLDRLATLLKTVDNKVFVSTAHDNLFKISEERCIRLNHINKENQDYTDIHLFKNRWYLSNKSAAMVTDERFKGKKITGKDFNFSAYTFDAFGNRLFVADYTSLFEIKRADSAFRLTEFNARRIRTLAATADDVIYIGDNSGLFKVTISKAVRQKIKGINAPVTKILKAKNGQLWVATKGDGLQVLENDKLRRISFAGKHDIFFDLAEDGSGKIWGSSENGLVSIAAQSGTIETRKYDIDNGLLSNDMGRIAINGNMLFVSTIEGLCALSIGHMINNVPPPVYLQSVAVNKKTLKTIPKELQLNYDQNSVSFTFDVLTYKNENRPTLKYRFTNKDSIWTESSENNINFDNLPPDTYNLSVYALNSDGVASTKAISVKFIIQKPYWKEYWFWAICVFLSGILLLLFIKKIIANISAKEAEKTRINALIAQSQLSALQAQMNPHFIFNAISSIQNYILKNDEKAAYNYLAKFGKLIRMVLNNSREGTLPLFQELETLQLYVELEQLRFKHSFNFILDIDKNVDTYTIYLPTMLIQPYVENAIWHGLMNLDDTKQGILSVKITLHSQLLRIIIEDNGIGRESANAFKKGNLHHPVGMQLTEQRLRVIHSLREHEGITIEITDLKNDDGKATGTRVVLYLPLTN